MKKHLYAILVAFVAVVLVSCWRSQHVQSEYAFTCKKCGATAMSCDKNKVDINTCKIIYRSDLFDDCNHVWKPGITSAYEPPLKNGTVVLVKKRNAYGAFILEKQLWKPESVVYKWWYRTDGGALLGTSITNCFQGTGYYEPRINPLEKISFGPFRIGWSSAGVGQGYIYYEYDPSNKKPAEDTTGICVIDAESVDIIDASTNNECYAYKPVWSKKSSIKEDRVTSEQRRNRVTSSQITNEVYRSNEWKK